VAVQSHVATSAIEPRYLYLFSQCTLVWDEEAWIIHEENQVIATWMGTVLRIPVDVGTRFHSKWAPVSV
jgi:hypothetical protein